MSQVENIVFGFLVRLSPSEGAPLFSLVNMSMQLSLTCRLAGVQDPPKGAKEVFDCLEKEGVNEEAENGLDEPSEILPWGIQMAGALIDCCHERVKKSFLTDLEKTNQGLYSQIRSLIFLFEDFATCDKFQIQRLVRGQDMKELALALFEVSEEVKEKFLSNLSSFNRDVVLDEIGYLTEVEPGHPEVARENFLRVFRKLVQDEEVTRFSAEG